MFAMFRVQERNSKASATEHPGPSQLHCLMGNAKIEGHVSSSNDTKKTSVLNESEQNGWGVQLKIQSQKRCGHGSSLTFMTCFL